MGSRHGSADRARERVQHQVRSAVEDLRAARIQHALTLADVGRPAGLSSAQVSRIERGLVRSVDLEAMAILCATVGLDVSLRTFPAGDPPRDAAHLELLEKLRSRLHPSVRWRTEVPLPIPGDLRAWDAVATVERRPVAIEAETRPRDLQALERRLALKLRDGGLDTMILLLADTRNNRRLVRGHGAALAALFPVPGRRAVELLAAGVHPGGSAAVLL